jgi:hypothetical protein
MIPRYLIGARAVLASVMIEKLGPILYRIMMRRTIQFRAFFVVIFRN